MLQIVSTNSYCNWISNLIYYDTEKKCPTVNIYYYCYCNERQGGKKTTVNPFTKAETGIQENSNQVFETLQITQKSTVL